MKKANTNSSNRWYCIQCRCYTSGLKALHSVYILSLLLCGLWAARLKRIRQWVFPKGGKIRHSDNSHRACSPPACSFGAGWSIDRCRRSSAAIVWPWIGPPPIWLNYQELKDKKATKKTQQPKIKTTVCRLLAMPLWKTALQMNNQNYHILTLMAQYKDYLNITSFPSTRMTKNYFFSNLIRTTPPK